MHLNRKGFTRRFHSQISKLTCSISQSFLITCLWVLKKKINQKIVLGSITQLSLGPQCFLPPKTIRCVLCGAIGHKDRSCVPMWIRGKGESNIAHYFHMPTIAAVVLHHCKLSSVQIPKKEMCLWGRGLRGIITSPSVRLCQRNWERTQSSQKLFAI